MWVPEFSMKQLKKSEGCIGRNIVCITIKMKTICYLMINSKRIKLATSVEGDPKTPFSIATTLRCCGGRYSFPRIAPLDLYLIRAQLPFFLCPSYDSTWDGTQVRPDRKRILWPSCQCTVVAQILLILRL